MGCVSGNAASDDIRLAGKTCIYISQSIGPNLLNIRLKPKHDLILPTNLKWVSFLGYHGSFGTAVLSWGD